MNNNIVKFPEMEKIDDDSVISTPAKNTGIKTIYKLRKSVNEIDVEKIFKITDIIGNYRNLYSYNKDTQSYTLETRLFKKVWDKKLDGWVAKIGLQQPNGREGWFERYPVEVKNIKEHFNDIEIKCLKFWGAKGCFNDLSDCKVFYDKNRGDILYVHYDLDVNKLDKYWTDPTYIKHPEIHKLKEGTDVQPKFFKNWLRSNIDTSIPNNWEDCHSVKEFKFFVETKTFEEITSKGFTYEDAEENLIKNDPSLSYSYSSREFNGVRRLVFRDDARNIDLRTNEEIIRDENKEDSIV